jgi:hypothetical protein
VVLAQAASLFGMWTAFLTLAGLWSIGALAAGVWWARRIEARGMSLEALARALGSLAR